MKKKPTKAEWRFDNILHEALKEFDLPLYKATQVKKTKWQRKKRKFKKQAIFTDQFTKKAYITDFFIPSLKLVIEIDGPSHNTRQSYDPIRSSFLATRGIKVVRFTNDETKDFHFCIEKTKQIIDARDKQLNSPKKQVTLSQKEKDKAIQKYLKHNKVTKCRPRKAREDITQPSRRTRLHPDVIG